MFFSFHGIVGVEIEDRYPWFDTLFIKPLPAYSNEEEFAGCKRFIRVRYQSKLKPVPAVDIGKGMQLTGKMLIDTGYGCSLCWENENTLVIQTTRECNEWLLICLQVMLLAEGYSLIHGAAFCRDSKGLLIASRAGAGKTGCVSEMVNQAGWQLLGDDMVIVSRQGEILSFLKDFVIYPYHKVVFPELFASGQGPAAPLALHKYLKGLVSRVKPVLAKFPFLFALARKYNPQSRRISPGCIFTAEQLAERAIVHDVIWLDRKQHEQAVFAEAEAAEITARAAAVSLLDILTDRCQAVLAVCGSGTAYMDFDRLFGQTRSIFAEAFSQARVFTLNVPVTAELTELADILIEQTEKIMKD